MLKSCFEAAKRLYGDRGGVVSFEYVMVAACILAAVAAAFGSGGTGAVSTALSAAISTISIAITSP